MANAEQLDAAMDYARDYDYDYFGFKTLERSYLLRANGKIVERPQHMLMRVSVGIHKKDVARAIETYNLLSQRCVLAVRAWRAQRSGLDVVDDAMLTFVPFPPVCCAVSLRTRRRRCSTRARPSRS